VTAAIAAILGASGWLVTARWLYGRWRGATYTRTSSLYFEKYTKPWPEGVLAAAAMVLAAVWPLVMVAAVVRFRPPPTAAEQAAANKALKAHVAELERELGLDGK
jgi:hypothetical protein